MLKFKVGDRVIHPGNGPWCNNPAVVIGVKGDSMLFRGQKWVCPHNFAIRYDREVYGERDWGTEGMDNFILEPVSALFPVKEVFE